MMPTTIITAGETFADIDAFACAVAYSELLKLEGKSNEVVLPGVLNSSITPTILSWNIKYQTQPSSADSPVVLVDISELVHVAKFVKPENIVEVYDHRFGFQDFWNEKLGDNSHVEYVGACATLIWDQYKKRGFENKISHESANLLTIAILSNTLDFGSAVTTERDVKAYDELKKYINLPTDWAKQYFSEVEKDIFHNVGNAIANDTKTLHIEKVPFPVVMGQLELWDASSFIKGHKDELKAALQKFGHPDWFVSIPSISEKRNYMYTESEKIKELLKKIIKIDFDGDVGVTDKLWLRKEIRKKLLEMI